MTPLRHSVILHTEILTLPNNKLLVPCAHFIDELAAVSAIVQLNESLATDCVGIDTESHHQVPGYRTHETIMLELVV